MFLQSKSFFSLFNSAVGRHSFCECHCRCQLQPADGIVICFVEAQQATIQFCDRHESTMCLLLSAITEWRWGHLWIPARHGPWPVQKRFYSVQEWHGMSRPGCWIVGSHTRWLLTTAADNQSCFHFALWSTGVVSAQIGRQATSHFCGWSNTSAELELELDCWWTRKLIGF